MISRFARGAMGTRGDPPASRARSHFVSTVDYLKWRWLQDEALVRAVGGWLATLHNATRRYRTEHAAQYTQLPDWTELHHGMMGDYAFDPEDLAVRDDPRHFGITHSDLNPSNHHVVDVDGQPPTLDVFDWDQCSRSWFANDLAQPAFGALLVSIIGSPLDSQRPEANPERFQDWLLTAYNAVSDVPVEAARLARMVKARTDFYVRFCTAAVEELHSCAESLTPMRDFCQRIVNDLAGKHDLTFPVGLCRRMLREAGCAQSQAENVAVFVAAALEYATLEMLELAAKRAPLITPAVLEQAYAGDALQELLSALPACAPCGFTPYVVTALHGINRNATASPEALQLIDGYLHALLQRLGSEGGRVAREHGRGTLLATDMQEAARLVFPSALVGHAVGEGMKACFKYDGK